MITYYSPEHKRRHPDYEIDGGKLITPHESPERAEIIHNQVQSLHLGDIRAPITYGLEPLLRIHDAGYVEFLQHCWQRWREAGNESDAIATIWPSRHLNAEAIPRHIEGQLGYYALAAETTISEGTWEAALASKDVALAATDAVIHGERSAFGLCRPPGHHATRDQFGGYCFFNNAAVAAQHALDSGQLANHRVAILDIDYHHGNGTQEIFYDRDDVLFISLHADPMDAFPYFLGHANEQGVGAGAGYNINYPMPLGTSYPAWSETLAKGLADIAAYAPDILIISLGLDTFEGDPISGFALQSSDYLDCGAQLASLGLPTVFLMEGGYAVDALGVNVTNVLRGFEGK